MRRAAGDPVSAVRDFSFSPPFPEFPRPTERGRGTTPPMSDLWERDGETSSVAHYPPEAGDVESLQRSRTRSDAELVRRFVRSRDEQAFEELERRYGALVRGVCARALDRNEDREDVYQATFLTLFLRARTIRRRSSVACWLYGVAYRIATRLRRKRKLERTELAFDPPADMQEVWVQLDRNHLSEVLDAELQALPTRDRLPLAMHYLMGLSHQEIGQSLGLSASAVDGRLKRARQRLRTRLLSRGVGVASALAYLGTCLQEAQAAAATAQSGTGAETLFSLFDGDAGASSISSDAQGLFAEEASMIAVGWGKGVLVAGGAALACCGLVGIFWGASVGPGIAQAQMGGGMGGYGGFFPGAEGYSSAAGPVVTVRLAGEQPAPQPGEAKFFSPLSDPPSTLGLLDTPAEAHFQEIPLGDAVEALAQQVGLEIQIDRAGLEEMSVAPDAPVSLESSSMTLADAFEAILSPMNLTYVAKERYVLITTKDRASEMTETRMYAIADHPLLRNADGNSLVNAIVGHVEPDSWAVVGGRGSVSLLPGVLIVTNEQHTLNQVECFLEQYGRLLSKYQPADDPAGAMMGMGSGMEGYGMPSAESSQPMRGVFGTARNPDAARGGGFGGGEGYEEGSDDGSEASDDESTDESGAAALTPGIEEGAAEDAPRPGSAPLRSGGGRFGSGGF
jgi:RNA polymerase sigma factor (sigma-70 family)